MEISNEIFVPKPPKKSSDNHWADCDRVMKCFDLRLPHTIQINRRTGDINDFEPCGVQSNQVICIIAVSFPGFCPVNSLHSLSCYDSKSIHHIKDMIVSGSDFSSKRHEGINCHPQSRHFIDRLIIAKKPVPFSIIRSPFNQGIQKLVSHLEWHLVISTRHNGIIIALLGRGQVASDDRLAKTEVSWLIDKLNSFVRDGFFDHEISCLVCTPVINDKNFVYNLGRPLDSGYDQDLFIVGW